MKCPILRVIYFESCSRLMSASKIIECANCSQSVSALSNENLISVRFILGSVLGHPLKAGQVFICHPERSEGSLARKHQILRFAQDDRQKKNSKCPALSGWPCIGLLAVLVYWLYCSVGYIALLAVLVGLFVS